MIPKLIALLSILSSFYAWGAPKKTVCTLTLNSSDEKMAFLKNLSGDQFNFIELADYEPIYKSNMSTNGTDAPWLNAACKAKVSCDVLVVSGHFAGSFFGESGLRISLDDMETMSCNSECDGIFHRPKEIFLFGCNTLAGKNADSRTPEQYRQALTADGFSPSEAEIMVAFRYSALGSSFGDRMMNVFAGVPRIYGFSSKAPLGKVTGPLVSKYLAKIKSDYSKALNSSSRANNANLFKIFGQTALTQTSGSDFSALGSSAACFLEGSNTDEAKLRWLSSEIESGKVLEIAGHLLQYLEKIRTQRIQLTPAAENYLDSIKNNSRAKNHLIEMLKVQSLPAVETVLANLGRELGWLSDMQYQSWLLKTFFPNGLSQISTETYTRICSYQVQLHLSYDKVDPSLLEDQTFSSLLHCIRPTDERFRVEYTNLIQKHIHDQNGERLASYIEPLDSLGKAEPKLQWLLFEIVEDTSRSNMLRNNVLIAISHSIPTFSSQQLTSLYALMSDELIKQQVLDTLMRKVPKRPDFLLAAVRATKNNTFYKFAYETLFKATLDPAVKSQLELWANENADPELRANAQLALNINEGKPYVIQFK